jgi:ribonuclease BN (tRNA processing enzyme)
VLVGTVPWAKSAPRTDKELALDSSVIARAAVTLRDVEVTVLGCSGSVPGPDSPTSGYLVSADDFRIVVELGNGTFGNLLATMDPFALGAVLLSHLHADHCGDFSSLATYRRGHPTRPTDPYRDRPAVYAPAAAQRRLTRALAPSAHHAGPDLTGIFRFVPLKSGMRMRIGPFDVEVAPMNHICETYGFRISHGGRTFVYSGDTACCPELVALAADADLLLADASWQERGKRPDRLHMSGREAADMANAAGVGQLLLTHVLPWSDRNGVLADAAGFRGPVRLAERGSRYTV